MDRVTYWTELSDYDYETAEAMLNSSRFLYVGFMCHQTIEKILKAYFNSKYDEPAPYTHSLSLLAKKQEYMICSRKSLKVLLIYSSH